MSNKIKMNNINHYRYQHQHNHHNVGIKWN